MIFDDFHDDFDEIWNLLEITENHDIPLKMMIFDAENAQNRYQSPQITSEST